MEKASIADSKKSEIHLHLRGCLTPSCFWDLYRQTTLKEVESKAHPDHRQLFSGIIGRLFEAEKNLEDKPEQSLFAFNNLWDFLGTYLFSGYLLNSEEDFLKMAKCCQDYLRIENIEYAEVTVSVREYLLQGYSLPQLKELLNEVSKTSHAEIYWILDPVRNFGPDLALSLLEEMEKVNFERFVGITLGGDELCYPASDFIATYQKARSMGLRTSIHVGESGTPKHMWDTLEHLAPERIGHGVQAYKDEKLMNHLKESNIPLEVSITSNFKTGVFPSIEAHPIRKLFSAGVPIIINTDDPGFFMTTLTKEFELLKSFGFNQTETNQLIANGYKYRFHSQ